MNHVARLVTILCSSALLFTCGGGDDRDEGSVDELCNGLCNLIGECMPDLLQLGYGSLGACVAACRTSVTEVKSESSGACWSATVENGRCATSLGCDDFQDYLDGITADTGEDFPCRSTVEALDEVCATK